MYYKIDDIQRDARLPANRRQVRLIVYVSYWLTKRDHDLGQLPRWREASYMDVSPTITRVVTNRNGWLKRKKDGVFINPATLDEDDRTEWERETLATDVPALIRANIERYLATRPSKRGAHFDSKARPTRRDDKQIVSRDDVLAIRGTGKEVVNARA